MRGIFAFVAVHIGVFAFSLVFSLVFSLAFVRAEEKSAAVVAPKEAAGSSQGRRAGQASGVVFAPEEKAPSSDPSSDPSPSPSPSPAPSVGTVQRPTATTGAPAAPANQQNPGMSAGSGGMPMMPMMQPTQQMTNEWGQFNKHRESGANDGRGGYGGNKAFKGKKCSLPNLDYTKFEKKWGKALLDRMSGAAPVLTENGRTLDGGLNLQRTAMALADDIGCKIDRDDHDSQNAIVAALVIAISCPESGGWNPTTTYDERKSGGIRGAGSSAEANESRGLLQMTKKSDVDRANGCHLDSQADLDGPITNLMCGLAKIKNRGYTTVSSFSEYWSVARTMTSNLKAAVKRECDAGFRNIKAYMDSDTAPAASTLPSSGSTTPAIK